jgi:NSS family neurotransmitter:Na+ symporter
LASLSADKSSLLGQVTLGGRGFFDWFDYLSSNILLPLGGLMIAILIGYTISKADLRREFSNGGTLQQNGIVNIFVFVIRYVTPALLIIVFLDSIGVIR